MKKSMLVIVAAAGLLAAAGLEAKGGHHGGGHHGGGWGHRGGHRGWRHGGWGRGGWGWGPGIGFGISVGAPAYGPDVVYLDDPYNWYWNANPNATWDSYGAWLEANSYRLRRPWRYYYGPRFQRRWRARPSVGFGIGFGI